MEIQFSNGKWQKIDKAQEEHYLNLALGCEEWAAKFCKRNPLTSLDEIKNFLDGDPKRTVRYALDWYAHMRADRTPVEPRALDYTVGRRLNCGHTVYEKVDVLTTSNGTACPDCYDRFSE